ncbi:F420-0:Gamma-glutamyl ligase [Synechococcus sp. C9]|uniref:F420-0:Gamma-glutamyl ligase n=1 Tax=Synechococcus sp. C9 TaxID=102119 RepID=UPI001FF330FF|nr:F420-0:Gamma-glutamyl ligase [Synechococcus sp. C9]
MVLGWVILFLLLGGGLGVWLLDRWLCRRSQNPLRLSRGTWQMEVQESDHYRWRGQMEWVNPSHRFEVMIPECTVDVQLLSQQDTAGITVKTELISHHPDAPSRPDGYWAACIIKTRQRVGLEVTLDIRGEDVTGLQAVWVRWQYVTYGPGGWVPREQHVVLPLAFPDPTRTLVSRRSPEGAEILLIRTHLLCHLDDPVSVIKRYAQPHALPGDIVVLGETPVAIMQGRWRHPRQIQPGWLARRLCTFFLPTSSLATACGLQTLIDLVGAPRVLGAFLVGAMAKLLLGKPGVFYQLAGEQAALIDDVTGTLPPYDQFVVLGPSRPQTVVAEVKEQTGLGAAIVDVNDLKAVRILARTADVDASLLTRVLVDNPAGNAAEQTPLLLIRPLPPEPPQPTYADHVDHPTAPPPGMESDPDPHGGWRPV